MSDGKWTKGPWRVAGKTTGYIMAPDGNGLVQIGTVGAYRDKELLRFNKERWDADAHLIAAAPDLYEALLELVATLRKEAPGTPLNNHRFDALGIKANAALSRARGESLEGK